MYLENTVSEIPFGSETVGQWESFNQSALIAIGIALEEMITTNLLPLAQLHVDRCRQLQGIPGNSLFRVDVTPRGCEKQSSEITQQEPSLPCDGCPSTRTIIPHAPGSSSLNQPLAERRNKDALFGLVPGLGNGISLCKNNMETLRILPH
jgi:hypothetical protein